MAVHHHEPYEHMTPGQRTLRRRLRAHARQLGDRLDVRSGGQAIDRLVHECAFEHWHGMLFARFLAENDLLIEPEMGVAISLDECEELAKEEGVDKWALASRFAHRMLPQVFRPDHPVFEVQFAREHRLKLEGLVEDLPLGVFTATDGLGWVYQFWQTRKKDEVNRSEVKIGADELPAVTQLFTDPYMVQFLLHNSLGAWWVSRHPDTRCPVELTYLRKTEEGVPAAGGFEGWPDDLLELRLLDPCCGSGHFLVTAFLMLVPMRMVLEGLSIPGAVDAVLRDNLHGLELDPRCVELAAFSLALAAWTYPGAGGYRTLPELNLACSGLAPNATKKQWLALAELAAAAGGMPPERDLFGVDDSLLSAPLRNSLDALYDLFAQAPELGSLIGPHSLEANLFQRDYESVRELFAAVLEQERTSDEQTERAVAAQGMARAAELLANRYTLVITNVPYLGREKHDSRLRHFIETNYSLSKHDLATVFLERLLRLCSQSGSVSLVLPQYWLFLTRYKGLRATLLKHRRWRLLVTLGPGAFETISGEVVNTCLVVLDREAVLNAGGPFFWIDASNSVTDRSKAELLRSQTAVSLTQEEQLGNPDSVIGYVSEESHDRLDSVAYCYQGLATSDNAQFVFNFWEVPHVWRGWELFQFAPDNTAAVSGCSHILLWEDGGGKYAKHAAALKKEGRLGGWKSGHGAWGKRGIAINRMGDLPVSLYFGTKFDCNVAVLAPHDVPRDAGAMELLSFSGVFEECQEVEREALGDERHPREGPLRLCKMEGLVGRSFSE